MDQIQSLFYSTLDDIWDNINFRVMTERETEQPSVLTSQKVRTLLNLEF